MTSEQPTYEYRVRDWRRGDKRGTMVEETFASESLARKYARDYVPATRAYTIERRQVGPWEKVEL